MNTNSLGQPIGHALADWNGAVRPGRVVLEGQFCCLEPLNVNRHAEELFEAYQLDTEGRIWTYLFPGPFANFTDFRKYLERASLADDPLVFVIIDRASQRAIGMASYMRIDPANGVIEVGGLTYSPALQRTPISTEAMFLMMRHAFEELGYRRYEWKCDSLNEPSRKAAARLGFTFEGIFRQAVVYKGRNRDTAWFSILDSEWPDLKLAFESWLSPTNFDDEGKQIESLQSFRKTRSLL